VATRAKLVGQVLALGLVAALLALLAWKVVEDETGGGSIVERVERGERPVAPELELDRLDRDGALSLASLRGKGVVLNFWASWCIPCKEEAPLLEQAWRDHRDKGLVVLGVDAQDFREDARSFLERFGVTYPVVHDGKGSTLGRFGVTGFPETFFIDRGGKVVAVQVGPFDDKTKDELENKIALALAET
jgi:cytochrome c biogenesis protein CcmG/thiol:disulfide interchange protein DsbE